MLIILLIHNTLSSEVIKLFVAALIGVANVGQGNCGTPEEKKLI